MTTTLEELAEKLSSIEKRLQTMENIEAIKQLQKQYMNAHMFVEAEEEISYFTDDGVLDVGNAFEGREAIANFINKIAAIEGPKFKNNPTKGAFVVHPIITVNGDEATGKWVQYELEADPDTHLSKSWFQSLYDIEYVKKNGKWQIKQMKWRPNVPHGEPEFEPFSE